MPKPMMHLAQFLVHGPTYHSLAMWRHPRTAAAGYDWTRPELYQHIARVCERGKLRHGVLRRPQLHLRHLYAARWRRRSATPPRRPSTIRSRCCRSWPRRPRRSASAPPISVSHQHPFHAARLWATLDHLTRGPRGVERRDHAQPQPVGQFRRGAAADRRALRPRARVHRGLPQAVGELGRGCRRDGPRRPASSPIPTKVHRIEHEGRFFKSRGPLNVVRSPQDGPAILQAGTSGKGRDFAARYADAVFAIQPYIAGAKALLRRHQARRGRGGPPAGGVQDAVRRAADHRRHRAPRREDKQAEHNALVPLEGGLAILSGHLDFDLSTLPLDTIMAASHRAQAAAHADALPHRHRRAR